MRPFIFLTVLSLPLVALPAQAQYRYPPAVRYSDASPGMALVDGWVRQYIGRAPSRDDLANGQAIDEGVIDPTTLLTQILGCDEYYERRAGGDDRRFVQVLFRDLAGKAPTPREAEYWTRRLLSGPEGMEGRTDVVSELLQRYSRATAPAASLDLDYRRPDYRDRERDYDRDWDGR